MTKKKPYAQVQPSAAYKAEVTRLFRLLNDPDAQAKAKARREKEHAERLQNAQQKNQRVMDHLHGVVAKEQARDLQKEEMERVAHNEAVLVAETERLTREKGPGVLFPCKRCGEFCTVSEYRLAPGNTCLKIWLLAVRGRDHKRF